MPSKGISELSYKMKHWGLLISLLYTDENRSVFTTIETPTLTKLCRLIICYSQFNETYCPLLPSNNIVVFGKILSCPNELT